MAPLAALAAAATLLVTPAHAWGVGRAWAPVTSTACTRPSARMAVSERKEVDTMRLSELKEELDHLGVQWRGVCFEKAELADALRAARLSPPTSPAPNPSAPVPSAPPPPSADRAQPEASDIESMNLKAIKEELKKRGVPTQGFFEKTEFVQALVNARDRKVGDEAMRGGGSGATVDDSDVVVGETKKMPKGGAAAGRTPGGIGGMPGGMGGMPGGMGGVPGGMGGIADVLAGLGGLGGMPGGMGGMPGGMGGMPGGMGGMPGGMGGMPGGMGGMGGLGDMFGKMMSNPRAMALMQKVQSNPKIMAALRDVQTKGFSQAAMAKYANDPEIMSLLREFQQIM